VTALTARAAYRIWAPRFDAETAVSQLESEVVASLGVETRGRSLLDVGCGTARRLRNVDAKSAVGVDLTFEMLAHGATNSLAAADVLALPFASDSFDVVWCRLVLGHVTDIRAAYAELSRVCVVGGMVVVTDIASEAVDAGHRRTFHDPSGQTHEVEHFVHSTEAHIATARHAALALEQREVGVVGPSIRSFYVDAGRAHLYDAQRGLALVVAMSFRKAKQ
jgi:malonyl-CoA O-methyltransferase